ncbi:response regulator [Sulfurimonas sp. SAG-AH-194-L11]|nr:response regulator [Sulfurimonas sp. SAG-AH-194-L11]MDF1877150.1 response regulator [Sulfurimonas sp. SAG-AH-194-L11]
MYKSFLLLLLFFLYSFNLDANSLLPTIKTVPEEEFSMWIALFGLGAIAIMALFISSEKIKLFKKEKAKEDKKLQEVNQAQDAIVSKMGENIHNLATENFKDKNLAKSENQILAITTNLIDFLRIKSNKVVIDHQKLKLSNLLNDVSGILKANIRGKEFELIYDIDKNVVQEINSDTLNLSKVLVNILLYCVENSSTQLTLKIKETSLFSKDDQLSFTVTSDLKINVEDGLNIFEAKYNDDTQEYDSLGLFIAKEFAKLMKGDLIARNDKNESVEFVFTIPYTIEKPQTPQNQYSIPKQLKAKSILLIDSSSNAAYNIANILKDLGHDVKMINKSEYTAYFKYFDIYDIIFLDEKLFTHKVVVELENTNSKIIAMSNLFEAEKEFPNTAVADIKISKPLTIWQTSDVLNQLFANLHDTSKITNNGIVNTGSAIVHRNSFQNTRNISLNDFSKFHSKKVLLVEDNVINQKVFVGILNKSNMNITVAKHGKEALKILSEDASFDIIFMDINMPVMDGYTASIKIRENTKFDSMPIIALSALTSSDEISKMFTSGMNGYMAKPLEKEKLYTVFSLFIQNVQQSQKEETQTEQAEIIELDGLNITLGISKSSSSEIFYKEILSEFMDAYGDTNKVFNKLLQDYRYEQLRILCIDIKGLTGSIGAQKLHLIVTDMLQKLSLKKYDYLPELVIQYTKELDLIHLSIDKYLKK